MQHTFSYTKDIRHYILFSIVLLLLTMTGCSSLSPNSGSKQQSIVDSRSVRDALSTALQAWEANDIAGADMAFSAMMEKGATSPSSLNHYAIFLREQWRLEEAEAVYLQALERAPQDEMTHYNLGILYDIYLGRHKQALGHYRKYQSYAAEPDKRVKGWVADLERRESSSQQEQKGS